MSSSKIEPRIDKSIKRRAVKSPLSSTAAETLLLLTKQIDKADYDPHLNSINPISTRRTNSDIFKKSFRRTQSTDYLKIITEKNHEIKKLQDDNLSLHNQISDYSSLMKKYHKLRNVVKEKDQTIESLRSSVEKLRMGIHILDNDEVKKLRRSSKRIKKSGLKINARLSLDSEFNNFDSLGSRPLTAAHRGIETRASPVLEKSESKFSTLNADMKNLFTKTEKILKAWKKAFKRRKNNP